MVGFWLHVIIDVVLNDLGALNPGSRSLARSSLARAQHPQWCRRTWEYRRLCGRSARNCWFRINQVQSTLIVLCVRIRSRSGKQGDLCCCWYSESLSQGCHGCRTHARACSRSELAVELPRMLWRSPINGISRGNSARKLLLLDQTSTRITLGYLVFAWVAHVTI